VVGETYGRSIRRLETARLGSSRDAEAVSRRGSDDRGHAPRDSTERDHLSGERSVSCKAQCDLAPLAGPLPASCPKACNDFRTQPDAIEYAASLDNKYGAHPDLKAMPMYCVAMSFKDVYDTGSSCRQPAWRNDAVVLVTTKGLMPYGGATGADPYLDRAGIQCRTVKDAALVLDALKDPTRGYFDPRGIYSALPKGLISQKPYASFASAAGGKAGKPLAEILPFHTPEYLQRPGRNGSALPYAVPGADVTKREYMVKAGEGQAPWSDKLNIRSVINRLRRHHPEHQDARGHASRNPEGDAAE
jgi:hypothetical protein